MILEMIVGQLGGTIVEKMFGSLVKIADSYNKREISETDAKKQMVVTLIGASKEVEVEHSRDLTATYKTFWDAANNDKTNLMKAMWAAALGSQIFVLFWSQWCVPMLFAYGYLGSNGWHAGTSAEWAYLIVIALLGMGPVVLRSGPGSGDYVDKLKSVVGKK